MVVVVQPGVFQCIGLLRVQHTQCRARLQPLGTYPFDHVQHALEIFPLRVAPRRTHAETRGTGGLGSPGRLQHLLDIHQPLRLHAGVVMRALRTVAAILRTAAGLDAQQGTDLHGIGVETGPVDTLGTK